MTHRRHCRRLDSAGSSENGRSARKGTLRVKRLLPWLAGDGGVEIGECGLVIAERAQCLCTVIMSVWVVVSRDRTIEVLARLARQIQPHVKIAAQR